MQAIQTDSASSVVVVMAEAQLVVPLNQPCRRTSKQWRRKLHFKRTTLCVNENEQYMFILKNKQQKNYKLILYYYYSDEFCNSLRCIKTLITVLIGYNVRVSVVNIGRRIGHVQLWTGSPRIACAHSHHHSATAAAAVHSAVAATPAPPTTTGRRSDHTVYAGAAAAHRRDDTMRLMLLLRLRMLMSQV